MKTTQTNPIRKSGGEPYSDMPNGSLTMTIETDCVMVTARTVEDMASLQVWFESRDIEYEKSQANKPK